MKKTIIAGIAITLVIFSFLIVCAQDERAPVLPVQVYGNITPILPDGHVIYFKIADFEYASSNIENSNFGYEPLLFLPADDLGTMSDKEGYSIAEDDLVEIYINSVKVKELANLTSPQEIIITLTTSQYNQIIGTAPTTTQTTTSKKKKSGGGGCFYRWTCGDWQPCLPNGTQIRYCTNNGTCQPKEKTMAQTCTYKQYVPTTQETPTEIPEPEKSLAWLLYVIIGIVIAGGIGFVIYEKERSHKSLQTEMKQPQIQQKSYQNLRDYVKNTKKVGYTNQQIRQELLKEGWSPKILKNIFAKLNLQKSQGNF